MISSPRPHPANTLNGHSISDEEVQIKHPGLPGLLDIN